MLAVELARFGNPAEVISVVEVAEPPAPDGTQALIQVEYAPLDHHDLLLARGTYPTLPTLPSVMGHEGVGRVIGVGPGVQNVNVGDVVLVPYGIYSWAQRVLAPAAALYPLPSSIDLRQAAMLRINPSTGGLLLTQRDDLVPGSWVVQNAGNSGVGRSVIATAKDRGLRTINLVRRPELAPELEELGADLVVLDSPGAADAVRDQLSGEPVLLGLDGVAGQATDNLAAVVSDGGLLVNYAVMSKRPFAPDYDGLAARKVHVEGFYMYSPDSRPKLPAVAERAQRLVAEGRLRLPVDAIIPAAVFPAALARLERGQKVLLDFNPDRA